VEKIRVESSFPSFLSVLRVLYALLTSNNSVALTYDNAHRCLIGPPSCAMSARTIRALGDACNRGLSLAAAQRTHFPKEDI